DFLRRHSPGRPALTRGFLLDRARLLVVPIGLETIVQLFTGGELCAGGAGLEFARRVVHGLREALRQAGHHRHLAACLDSVAGFALDEPTAAPLSRRAAGVTPWDRHAAPKQQLGAAGLLHTGAETGTAAILLPEEETWPTEEVVQLLRQAWQQ